MGDATDPTGGARVTSIDVLAEMIATLKVIQQALQNPPKPESITEEERGLLIVLRLKNPTQNSVATAMGYKNYRALKKFPVVLEAIRRIQMMRTVTRGSGRSITDHTLADDSAEY